ncbi:MAG TPA: signal peptidase II [Gemmatimonadales bacterium]|nr:signal peptidase II [Gemmatimonadales bacterium]
MTRRSNRNASLFWGVMVGVLVLDIATKWLAVRELPFRVPQPLVGELVQFTLIYNPGAAFGLHLGPYSRWIFMALTFGALFVLGKLYTTARDGDWQRVLAVSLVCSGAIGNLVDRVRSSQGVVDFIDVGIGSMRWPTFNIADMAISCGAVLLAWVLWWEDHPQRSEASASATGVPDGQGG